VLEDLIYDDDIVGARRRGADAHVEPMSAAHLDEAGAVFVATTEAPGAFQRRIIGRTGSTVPLPLVTRCRAISRKSLPS